MREPQHDQPEDLPMAPEQLPAVRMYPELKLPLLNPGCFREPACIQADMRPSPAKETFEQDSLQHGLDSLPQGGVMYAPMLLFDDDEALPLDGTQAVPAAPLADTGSSGDVEDVRLDNILRPPQLGGDGRGVMRRNSATPPFQQAALPEPAVEGATAALVAAPGSTQAPAPVAAPASSPSAALAAEPAEAMTAAALCAPPVAAATGAATSADAASPMRMAASAAELGHVVVQHNHSASLRSARCASSLVVGSKLSGMTGPAHEPTDGYAAHLSTPSRAALPETPRSNCGVHRTQSQPRTPVDRPKTRVNSVVINTSRPSKPVAVGRLSNHASTVSNASTPTLPPDTVVAGMPATPAAPRNASAERVWTKA
eukprot:CAMPEP_0179206158 /NCGR_PEP_ID=MMETSP0796-20121207/102792_1 /TAXON_ID=73915 /ORGANISM="Pyrodinium bahamense, Strain pbaha01" /LENGTH=369 /DNA_ID=CAMNT_0020911073 /DNA_START=1 /DNA_END=1107 /DNA_ORIENTATION=+